MTQLDLQAFANTCGFLRALHVRLDRADAGVTLDVTIGEMYAIGADATHGGVVATVLDTAATFALIAETEQDWVTVDLRVDYLRPTPLGHLRARGEVFRVGRSLGRARSDLVDASGNVCATAVGTFAPAGPIALSNEGRDQT